MLAAVPLGLGRPSQQAATTTPCIIQRFRCWFSPEDGNAKPQHVLLKPPQILHGSHHVPCCGVFSNAAATMGGMRVSTHQAGAWDGHVTPEPLSGSLHTAVRHTRTGTAARTQDKTPQWPLLQSGILAAIYGAGGRAGESWQPSTGLGGRRGACVCTSSRTRVADNHPHTQAQESGPEPAGNRVLVIPSCFPDATQRRCPRRKGESDCFQGHTPRGGTWNQRTETGIWAKAISSRSCGSMGKHRPIRSALLLSNYQGPSSLEHPGNPAPGKHLDPFLGLMS